MSTVNFVHQPVLLHESIERLAIRPNGIYVDATFGRGGHAREILRHLDSKGQLVVLDKDLEAIAEAKSMADPRIKIIHGSFAKLEIMVNELGLQGKIDGILLDLGVSSPQLDNAKRGFSFLQDGPLDMRMNALQDLTAEKWLNSAAEDEIAMVLKQYGEERFSKRIAHAITEERSKNPIKTTSRLAKIASEANPRWEKNKHPATRTFQALRILVNNELEELKNCLDQCLHVLAPGGRLLVLSFHSLEDRIVKEFIRKESGQCNLPREIPVTKDKLIKRLKCIGSAIRATEKEINSNPRARSATLRVMEKIV